MENKFNKDNFFNNTYGVFDFVSNPPSRKPDFISCTGSEYWYEKDFLYRRSNHWSGYFDGHSKLIDGCVRISTCKWYLRGIKKVEYNREYTFKTGSFFIKEETRYLCDEYYTGKIKFDKLKNSTIKNKK